MRSSEVSEVKQGGEEKEIEVGSGMRVEADRAEQDCRAEQDEVR